MLPICAATMLTASGILIKYPSCLAFSVLKTLRSSDRFLARTFCSCTCHRRGIQNVFTGCCMHVSASLACRSPIWCVCVCVCVCVTSIIHPWVVCMVVQGPLTKENKNTTHRTHVDRTVHRMHGHAPWHATLKHTRVPPAACSASTCDCTARPPRRSGSGHGCVPGPARTPREALPTQLGSGG